jgi:outer membrane protein
MKPCGCRAIHRRVALVIWLAAWTPLLAWADNGAPALKMSEAIVVALQHNPQVQAARHQVDAAMARVTQARSGLLPQLDASETFNRTTSPLWAFGTKLNQGAITQQDFSPDRLNNPDPINNFSTALTLTWSLFDGGKTWIGWQQARQNEQAGRLALKRSEQATIAQTAIVYAGCLLAREDLAVVDQALDTARVHLKVVQDRERSGMAVKSDLLRAQVRIADLEQQRFKAESQVSVALAMLGAVMGQPEQVPEGIRLESPPTPRPPDLGDLQEWIRRAMDKRPDLEQLTIQEEIARKEVVRARAGHYPTLALQGSYENNTEAFDDSKDNYTIGAVLRVNLFSGQRISAQVAEARAALAGITSMRNGLQLSVRVDTQKAYYQAQSAWQSIQVAQTAVNQAREGMRIITNRYENGLLALVSLLDAQVALQQAQTQHFQALHDYEVARISLDLASGVIDQSLNSLNR